MKHLKLKYEKRSREIDEEPEKDRLAHFDAAMRSLLGLEVRAWDRVKHIVTDGAVVMVINEAVLEILGEWRQNWLTPHRDFVLLFVSGFRLRAPHCSSVVCPLVRACVTTWADIG